MTTVTAIASEQVIDFGQHKPVYQVLSDDPERLKIINTLALISAALARVDKASRDWETGVRRVDATRFVLEGRRSALVATIAALEGDCQALKDL